MCDLGLSRPGGSGSKAMGSAWAAAVTNDSRGARSPALPRGLVRPPEGIQEARRPLSLAPAPTLPWKEKGVLWKSGPRGGPRGGL